MNNSLLTAIICPLLPAEPHLEPGARADVEETVVGFVSAQINGMVGYLRIPYRMMMTGFNWLALRPYGKPYTRLDEVKQRDYLSIWIHSRIGIKRDFIKLIRSCALLQFYDHPLVMKKMEGD